MRILLATDGSPCSELAVRELCQRTWPADTEVEVVSMPDTPIPLIPDPLLIGAASHYADHENNLRLAQERVEQTAQRIRGEVPGLRIFTRVIDEAPAQSIVDEAKRWDADLILVGSHGYGPFKRFLLGSVSQAVVQHAPCSVEIVRCKHPKADEP